MNYKHLVQTESLQYEDIKSLDEKTFIVDDVYEILVNAYMDIKGGLNFTCRDDLVYNTDLWRIIYLDEVIVGVVIYKAKKGLKMVALGISNCISKSYQYFTKTMLSYIFKKTFNNSWMEVSEGVEKFIVKHGGDRFFVKNSLASEITGKEILSLNEDGYHYTRVINGVVKSKVIVGTTK